jgi:hypothetical protein
MDMIGRFRRLHVRDKLSQRELHGCELVHLVGPNHSEIVHL